MFYYYLSTKQGIISMNFVSLIFESEIALKYGPSAVK